MQQHHVSEASLNIGPAGPGPAETSTNTMTTFTNEEGWQATIGVGSTTLSVGAAYAGVDDFARRLRDLCSVLRRTAGVLRADRLGVRYLDIVPIDPTGADGWTTWFRPELVGVMRPDLLGDTALVASITETRLARAPHGVSPGWSSRWVQSLVRHGVLPTNSVLPGVPPQSITSPSFVLDLDVFVVGGVAFDEDAVADQYRALHREVERLFHWALTEEGGRRFGLVYEQAAVVTDLRSQA